jgi:hypothetical protein
MYCYFSVHFDKILENRKLRSLLNQKNQNGTHRAYSKAFFKRITLKNTTIKKPIFHLHSYTQILDCQ